MDRLQQATPSDEETRPSIFLAGMILDDGGYIRPRSNWQPPSRDFPDEKRTGNAFHPG